MALLALTIARHWSRLPEAQIATIARWVGKVRVHQEGMTEKNRDRLRQFADDKVIRTFLTLPDRLIEKALRLPVNTRAALMVQKAVAIALLSVAPLRLENLRCLDRRQHFRRAFSVDDPRHQLVIPAAVVKNKVDLEFPIPPRIMDMIELYIATYQPLLTNGHPSTLLFPGRTGQAKHDTALRSNITDVVYKELGLRVNPHLFRDCVATSIALEDPEHVMITISILGHSSLSTAEKYYNQARSIEAGRAYQDVVMALRREIRKTRRSASRG